MASFICIQQHNGFFPYSKDFLWVISLLQRVWFSFDNHTLGRLKTLIFGSWLAMPLGCDYLRKLALSVMPNCLIIIAASSYHRTGAKVVSAFPLWILFPGVYNSDIKKKKSMFCRSTALTVLFREPYFFNRLFLSQKLGPCPPSELTKEMC